MLRAAFNCTHSHLASLGSHIARYCDCISLFRLIELRASRVGRRNLQNLEISPALRSSVLLQKMKHRSRHWQPMLLLLLLIALVTRMQASSKTYRPVVLLHGIMTGATSMQLIEDEIKLVSDKLRRQRRRHTVTPHSCLRL